MNKTPLTEIRVVNGFYVDFTDHFFFDGVGFTPGTLGKGNYAGHVSGAIHGKVKVVMLRNGRVSLRSVGPKGNGRLVHLSTTAKVVVDGKTFTAASLAS
jgi:hypothetical protein